MPTILKHDIEKFERKKDSFLENNSKNKFNYYKSPYIRELEIEEGGSLFSGIVSGIKTGVNLIKNNKDLISGVASLGSTASNIAQAVKASKDLDQLKTIQELREKSIQENKRKGLSEEAKQKLKQKLISGSGFVEINSK